MTDRSFRVLEQKMEEVKFCWCQFYYFAVYGCQPFLQVEGDLCRRDNGIGIVTGTSPQDCAHAREQFFEAKRFGEIIIRASIKRLDLISFSLLYGEDNNRHV